MIQSRVVIICGDRNWRDKEAIADLIVLFDSGTVVITGAAPGADSLAHDLANIAGLVAISIPAAWHALGKRAGPIRNDWMLRVGLALSKDCPVPLQVFAFHDHLASSKGHR